MNIRERFKRVKDFRICPRCGNKCLKSQERCDECDLVFSRLQFASNKVAKRQLLHFNRDFVVYTNELPSDVKRWKLILFSSLFGLVGAHYFYVGKFGKAILMCLGLIYWVSLAILNPILVGQMEYLYIPIAIYGCAWIVSLIYVLVKKFKVPVLIDERKIGDEILAQKEDFDRTKQQIIAERKKLEKTNNDADKGKENKSAKADFNKKKKGKK